jgi:Zn-dependent M28 family amino/carboxypeptidase
MSGVEAGVRSPEVVMRRCVLVLALAIVLPACTSSDDGRPSSANGSSPPTVEGMRAHLDALQAIADEHGGTRVVGSPGYEASVDYVLGVLGDAGYEIATETVDMPAFEQASPTVLELVEPTTRTWTDDVDLRAMIFSGSGDVTGRVIAAEGGCEAGDLAGFPEGDVALLEPGPCLRRDQVVNAQEAGASAVVFPYEATAEGRPLRPTLLHPDGIEIPALCVTPEVGETLASEGGEPPTVHIAVEATSTRIQPESVIAQTAGGDPGRVVMLGAHLDSVMDGPGINDNGSGVAMLLEIARWNASRETGDAVRFAFWAGEEEGLYGSRAYVAGLTPGDLEAIEAYLELDMLASPNFIRYVIADAPAVSEIAEENARIQDLFTAYFEELGQEVEPIETYGGADHGPFAQAGVPVGGLFAGSADPKTPEQAEIHGGEVGELMDPCYHQACDTVENVSDLALEQFVGAYVAVLTELAGGD